jgi:transposase
MKEEVILNKKEQKRLMVLNKLDKREISTEEAAQLLDLSVRHIKRLRSRYGREGPGALAHGNRGRKPVHALSDDIRHRIVALAQSKYAGFNQQHYTEKLAEKEGISVSRASVRRILSRSGIRSPRKRRPPKHRRRRDRYPHEGLLLQVDGSPHDWFEGRGPKMSLIAAIDDATGKVPCAIFRKQEDAQGYVLLLQQLVADNGIPVALYHDRHSIFERTPADKESIEEQLEGKREPTQLGRIMEDLGISSISAMTPQAKGRIERLWGTFQDRLVSELRLAGIRTIGEANAMLPQFLSAHNRRFTVPPQQQGTAYRKTPARFVPQEVFCFKYSRTVGKDNVVRFGNQRLQIFPSNGRSGYAFARVEVHERMDGSIAVYYQGKCLLIGPAPAEAPILRTRRGDRPSAETLAIQNTLPIEKPACPNPKRSPVKYKPASNHPWRRYAKVNICRG